MSTNIDNIINKVNNAKRVDNGVADSLGNLSKELNNLKVVMSPNSFSISSSASTLASTMSGMLECTFSPAPGSYLSIRATTLVANMPSSNISDTMIGANVVPFPVCIAPTNPVAPAQLMIPPYVCVPMLSPFTPTNPTILLENMPITTEDSIAMCMYAVGGVVSFTNPGQFTVKTS